MDSTPGAWETGKNVPPSRPRTTDTTDCQLAACSAFLATDAIRDMIPMAEAIAATMSIATPSGLPQSAPNSSVVATTSTVMLMTPSPKLVSSLPPRIEARLIGAASSRASVPSLRSSSRLVTPNWTVKNRKNTAIPAAKKDLLSSCLVCAETSLTATGVAAAAAWAARACVLPPLPPEPASDGGDRQPHAVQLGGVGLGDGAGHLRRDRTRRRCR